LSILCNNKWECKPFTKRYFGFGNNNGNANHLQKRYFGFGNKFRNKTKTNHLLSAILGLGIIMGMQTIYKSAILGFGNKFRNKKQNRIDSQIQLKPEKNEGKRELGNAKQS